jgi:hypothetical protein
MTASGQALQAHAPPEPALNTSSCNHCGARIDPWSRADRRTHSTTCRVAVWRAENAHRGLNERQRPGPPPRPRSAVLGPPSRYTDATVLRVRRWMP